MSKLAIFKKYLTILAITLTVGGLYYINLFNAPLNHPLTHSLIEVFGVCVASSIFILGWNSRQFQDNNYFLFMSIAYLFVGILELLHVLSSPGTDAFRVQGFNLSIQLGVASRYVESISFLIAPLLIRRQKLKPTYLFLGFTMVISLLLWSIFYGGIFPVCAIERAGLTPFAMLSEYGIGLILLAAIALLIQKRKEFNPATLRLLVASIILTIGAAESAYLFNPPPASLISHLVKVASFYLIYKAIIVTGLMKPYHSMFRNLKQREDTLRESQILMAEAQRLAHLGSYEWDIPEDNVIWSEETDRILGIEAQESNKSLERVFTTFVHPDDRDYLRGLFDKACRDKNPFEYQHQIVRPDGSVRILQGRAEVFTDTAGNPVKIIGCVQDTTVVKQAEDALRESEKKYRQLVENAQEGIWAIDTEARTTFVNPCMARMLGYTVDEMSGKPFFVFMDEHNVAMASHYFERRKQGIREQIEFEFLHKDGSKVYAILENSPIIDDGGHFAGALALVTDITERKRAEDALRKQERLLDFAQVFIRDAEDRITFWNTGAEKLYGWTKKEAQGQVTHTLFKTQFPVPLKEIREILLRKGAWEGELVHEKKDGTSIVVASHWVLQQDDRGLPVAVLEVNNDITELRRAEDALRKQGQIIDQIHDSVVSTDLDGYVTSWNKGAERLFGYTQREALGRHISFLYPEDEQDVLKDKVIAPLKEKGNHEMEVRSIRKTGENIYTHLSLSLMSEKDGNVIGMVGYAMDITERKRAEDALKETSDYLEKLIRYASAPIIVWDPDMAITRFNDAFERLTGYTADEVIGQKVDILFPDLSQNESLHKITLALSGEYWQSVEIPILCEDGKTHVVLWNSANIYAEDNTTLLATIAQGVDITDRKLAEEEKEKIQTQLLQSQKMEAIGLLAGGVAHDFNNLLTIIQGYTTMVMMKTPDSDHASRDLNQIRLAAGRAANLTRQLLLFGRRQPLEPASFNLNRTIDNLLKMLYRLIGEDITVITELEPDLWEILADEGTIEQVIMNLAVNARDAMPKGGKLTIRTENIILHEEKTRVITEARPGHFIVLSIADTGTGMDKEIVARIFEPFFTTKEVGKGSGLGLSVAYGIVKQHEGWINVYSEPGQGTVFKTYLPAAFAGKPVKETRQVIPLKDLQGKNERILVVEDEKAVRELAGAILRKNGYSVIEAANTQEALNIFEQEKGNFHLVLSDVVLPDQTGLELVDQLILRQPKLRVILVSGYPDQKAQWTAIRERGYRFLQKPYTLTDLLRMVREVIEPGSTVKAAKA